MSGPVNIAFHAPLKAPDHPVPSGDRTMAGLLFKALRQAGFAPRLASTFRSFEGTGDPARQQEIRQAASQEADIVIARLRQEAEPPQLWFSYHVYYKAPDWIGPKVAAALGIPYVVAEGSRAMKRADGPWAVGHRGAEQALDRARIIFAMTEADTQALLAHKPAGQSVVPLPPFIDADAWLDPEKPVREPQSPLRLLTVAMMREGDKLQSYRQLAETLAAVTEPWRLDIVGDGPAREKIEALFAAFGSAVTFHGESTDQGQLAAFYADADLLVWPAVNEAYGMVFLEAQAQGCPVVAGNHGGVASVVRNGETGILVSRDDPKAFAAAIDLMAADPALRRRLGMNARHFIRTERTLDAAAARLEKALLPLMRGAMS